MEENAHPNGSYAAVASNASTTNDGSATPKNNKSAFANRSTNFSSIEDLFATKAYLQASEDPISGAKQKGLVFKTKIEAAYNILKQKQEDLKKANYQKQPHLRTLLSDGHPPMLYPRRSGNSIHLCFKNTISPSITKFISIVKANPKKSGEDPVVWKMRLLQLYKDRFGTDFKFFQCYKFAKDTPKFMAMFGSDDGAGNSRNAGDPEENKKRTGAGSSANRPIGTKKAKKMKKEDEMVDRLAKKFGIEPNNKSAAGAGVASGSNNSFSSSPSSITGSGNQGGGWNTTRSSMNAAVAHFLSVAGQGLSAWMMKSMSTDASDEIRRQYADECMKAEILKLKEANSRLTRKAARKQEIKKVPKSIVFGGDGTNTITTNNNPAAASLFAGMINSQELQEHHDNATGNEPLPYNPEELEGNNDNKEKL